MSSISKVKDSQGSGAQSATCIDCEGEAPSVTPTGSQTGNGGVKGQEPWLRRLVRRVVRLLVRVLRRS